MTDHGEYSDESQERGGQTFHLDDEQRGCVCDCLKKAGLKLVGPTFDSLVRAIEASIGVFEAAEPELSDRQKRDLLRKLWVFAHADDPPIGIIRGRIQQLPKQVLDYIDYRAWNVVPRLEEQYHPEVGAQREPPPTPLSGCRLRRQQLPVARVDRESWMRRGGFREWARTAPADLLCAAVAVLTAEGAHPVPGRSRGGGKRSGARLEPRILGVVRGAQGEKPKGGRPSAGARQSLVMHLACDWSAWTDCMPETGRSDHTGFGDLVHSVFQWIGLSPDEAEYALRTYWEEVQSIRSSPVEGGVEYS